MTETNELMTTEHFMDVLAHITSTTPDLQLTTIKDDDGQDVPAYVFVNEKEILKNIELAKKLLDDYDYLPEDRKELKNLATELNKLANNTPSIITKSKSSLYALADVGKKSLVEAYSELRTKVLTGVNNEDARIKREKVQRLADTFLDSKNHIDSLRDTDLEFEQIQVASWSNLTSSEDDAIISIKNRLETLDYLITQPSCPTENLDAIIKALNTENWDGLKALNRLQREDTERKEALARQIAAEEQERIRQEARRKRLEEEKQAKNADTPKQSASATKQLEQEREIVLPAKLIKIEGQDWERAESLLKSGNIRFQLLS